MFFWSRAKVEDPNTGFRDRLEKKKTNPLLWLIKSKSRGRVLTSRQPN